MPTTALGVVGQAAATRDLLTELASNDALREVRAAAHGTLQRGDGELTKHLEHPEAYGAPMPRRGAIGGNIEFALETSRRETS